MYFLHVSCPLVVGIPLALLTVGEPDKKYWLLEYMDNTVGHFVCKIVFLLGCRAITDTHEDLIQALS